MLDSMKMTTPKNQANKPADFLFLISPFPTIQLTNPFIPPEYWVNVITAPIIQLNSMTLVLSALEKTCISELTVFISPLIGFQLQAAVQPSQKNSDQRRKNRHPSERLNHFSFVPDNYIYLIENRMSTVGKKDFSNFVFNIV
jgi:hypothetical protein